MTPNEMKQSEPRFRPDFAAQVLREADLLMMRRRRARRVLAGTGTAIVAFIAIVSGGILLPLKETAPRLEPVYVAGAAPPAARQGDQSDPLLYLFPDAPPLAGFAAQYSDATDNDVSDGDPLVDQDDGAS